VNTSANLLAHRLKDAVADATSKPKTSSLGRTRTPNLLIRRSRHTVRDRTSPVRTGWMFHSCPHLSALIRRLGSRIGNGRQVKASTDVYRCPCQTIVAVLHCCTSIPLVSQEVACFSGYLPVQPHALAVVVRRWSYCAMAVGDSPVGVTICKRGRQGLYADNYGVTVRNWRGSELRFAWSEISRFADGSRTGEDVQWVLLIVLHTGRTIDVGCTWARPTPEMLDAVRHVAARYKIPADLTGVPTEKDGRPAKRGLYEDPGGRAGLRYWDGGQWSPLVPLDIGKSETVRKSAGSWSALPVADGSWTYAAARARFYAVVATVCALGSAGLLVGLYSSRDSGVGMPLSFGAFAAIYVLMTRWAWIERKFFLKLNEAAKQSPRN
jgi:hypothetical protein